jgi:hypothetical protein
VCVMLYVFVYFIIFDKVCVTMYVWQSMCDNFV